MSFDVSADAYVRFMGRYSEPLAVRFADLAGVRRGQWPGCARWAGLPGPAGWWPHACGITAAAAARWPRSGARCATWTRRQATSRTWPGPANATWRRSSRRPGLGEARASTLTVVVRQASFGQWWEPFTLGVGPAGAYVASLAPARRGALREHCRHLLPAGPVEISATAWAVTWTARVAREGSPIR